MIGRLFPQLVICMAGQGLAYFLCMYVDIVFTAPAAETCYLGNKYGMAAGIDFESKREEYSQNEQDHRRKHE